VGPELGPALTPRASDHPTGGNHGAVALKPHRMSHTCGDLDYIRPAADIALSIFVPSHGDHGAVGFDPHCVTPACSDLDCVRPVANITLPIFAAPGSDHGAIGLKPHRVTPACSDLDCVRPVADITLSDKVFANSYYRVVIPKSNRVSALDKPEQYTRTAGCHLNDVGPTLNVTLPGGVSPHGDCGIVASTTTLVVSSSEQPLLSVTVKVQVPAISPVALGRVGF